MKGVVKKDVLHEKEEIAVNRNRCILNSKYYYNEARFPLYTHVFYNDSFWIIVNYECMG